MSGLKHAAGVDFAQVPPAEDAPKKGRFPAPMPISKFLATVDGKANWLWEGYLPERGIVLLSALQKVGKTTLLGGLLQAISRKQDTFCGLPLRPGKVLIVTQEDPTVWKERQGEFELSDEFVHFQPGSDGPAPFTGPASLEDWLDFIDHLAERVRLDDYKLVVVDVIADFWPVEDENKAREISRAVLPLRKVTRAGCTALLLHHNRKKEGAGGTAARGSGQLAGIVDVAMEVHYLDGEDKPDRLIKARSRFKKTPRELVVTRTQDGYTAAGTAKEARRKASVLAGLHPDVEVTVDELAKARIAKAVGDGLDVNAASIKRVIRDQLDAEFKAGRLKRAGGGGLKDPYRYSRR